MDVDLSRAVWRKSTWSNGNGGDCIEVAFVPAHDVVAVRDSKAPNDGTLTFDGDNWRRFVEGIKTSR